jgi:hypothetical protein
MKRKALSSLGLILLLIAVNSCRANTDKTPGSVVIVLSDFNGLPVQVSARTGPFQITTVTVRAFLKDPGATTTTNLENVEIKSYQIVYRRRDSGTRTVPTLEQGLFGFVAPNSTTVFNNLPILLSDQLLNPPLHDLATLGFDSETRSTVIPLDCTITIFGTSLSGDKVASDPSTFTIEVTP